ncbi:sigma 54-interacting response regulator [Pedobacter rhizosphaerae]|uniref:Response regulator receiver domain-containing protein n=1 Tax=Pedobacter rhizosphaerae TaxID=390241 RepID=A0A1H9VCB0_9SPHI|nr:sigma 54-interacting response regulator [Pedobacter rhizosphaerae]SES19322.1 Response regulator receiver domain-containing protein [Pedobacter rhizosphaerae]
MKQKILIVEDEFIVANDLRIMLEKAGYKVCGIAPSVVKALELIGTKEPDWILLDIFLQGDKTGIDLAGQLTEMGIPFIYISANTNQGILEAAKATLPYGFLVKPFREKDLMVMLDIARYRHEQNLKYNQHEEPSLQKQIEHITEKKESSADRLKQVAAALYPVVPFQFLWITKSNPRVTTKETYIIRRDDGKFNTPNNESLLKEANISSRDFKAWNATAIVHNGKSIFNGYDFRKLRMENPWIQALSDHYKLESAIVCEIERDGETFQFVFFHHLSDLYTKVHTGIVNQFKKSWEQVLDKIIYSKDAVTETPLAIEISLEKPFIKTEQPPEPKDFNGIVGNSKLLHAAFKKLELVAPDDTSVLILGESGTGKEKIAQTIHKLSPRKNKPLITVNCAALPLTLIESELFGHEKGSFTGANEKRIGKFEQADGGSIFLDEIGELPLEAQVKLLRVLQEKEIERLGGNYTKKINVRIITATNRNLEKEVAEGRFRLDLYYRLNVFPIELPALRQRKEDIPVLTQYFIDKYGKKGSSNVSAISTAALNELQDYDWPGNIRELEHLIERTMVLTEGDTITAIELPGVTTPAVFNQDNQFKIKTMEEMEREHILSILKMCKGKIFGPGGAAEILNIPSTTLNSKIKKLGIKFEFVK